MLEAILFVHPTVLILSASVVILLALLPTRVVDIGMGRWLMGGAVFVCTCLADYSLLEVHSVTSALEPLLFLLAVLLFGVTLFRLSLTESLYYTVWCYLLSQLLSQFLLPTLSDWSNSGVVMAVKLVIYFVSELVLYWAVRYLFRDAVSMGRDGSARRQSLLTALSVLTASLIFADHHFVTWLIYGAELPEGAGRGGAMIGIFRMVFDMLCVAVIYMQCGLEHSRAVELELFTVQQLWKHQQSQYEHSRENIELINRKCHDMKYQIRALRSMESSAERDEQIKDMERSIMIYDSAVKTGDPVLDTVLTEKSLFCESHGITLTCMADGDGLRFMRRTDLYTILGNALDNAIENVLNYPEREKRVIQVSVLPKGELHVIRIRNYCEAEPIFENGLPVSTKEDNGYHGFGLKSIRMIAEQYNGSVTCSWEEGSFLLQILLSSPPQENT